MQHMSAVECSDYFNICEPEAPLSVIRVSDSSVVGIQKDQLWTRYSIVVMVGMYPGWTINSLNIAVFMFIIFNSLTFRTTWHQSNRIMRRHWNNVRALGLLLRDWLIGRLRNWSSQQLRFLREVFNKSLRRNSPCGWAKMRFGVMFVFPFWLPVLF